MPCRRPGSERFLLLERAAVTLPSGPVVGSTSSGSREVDALVAKLGEVLQLNTQHRTPPLPAAPAVAAAPATPCLLLPPKHHSRDRAAPYASPRGLGFFASLRPPHSSPHPSLVLLQTPVHPPPPPPPTTDAPGGSPRVAKQLCGRGWLRSAARAGRKKRQHYHHHHHPHPLLSAGDDDDEEDDPHRLLQQLILSGNLIKEAVRRLQLAATVATTATAASETSTTGSPGSASSTGSCCHSSDGGGSERDSDAAFAVSSLQALP
ncbi:hypothetical protein JRQ81_010495 [Phrynocephalus forsythii]|uniref:GSK-3-binding protein n=1 Tax=Phrynocephalus forsythii TaxID=171643 RepID=A0A9Q0Y3A2_9SAUR|nr:hypothetical protein JRQ81_010495 [Phrynocephalus forsythii]